MPEPLRKLVHEYLESLARENASPHTLRNYETELLLFVEYLTPKDSVPPPVEAIDVLTIREWMSALYDSKLSPASIRRKLAAVRLSLVSNSLLIILKGFVGLSTASISVLSEAVHSGMDLIAAVIAAVGVAKAIKEV